MKSFEDLEFKPWTQLNGIDSYEVAVMKDGILCYDTPITDDVIGYVSKEGVTRIMKQIQEL